MAAPALTETGQEFYDAVLPLAYADEAQGWALLQLSAALAVMFDEIAGYVRDTDAGPGWSVLVDVARAPAKALPWLGQFVGVTVNPLLSDAAQRAQIRDEAGMRRGTPAAMAAAAMATLTGTQSVLIRERFGGAAYQLQVVTKTAETPTPSLTLAALLSQKPAGLVLTHTVLTGQDYQHLYDTSATYQIAFTKYATYQGVLNDAPGT